MSERETDPIKIEGASQGAMEQERLAAFLIPMIEKKRDEILANYVEGDPHNIGHQIMSAYLAEDKDLISISEFASKHPYFSDVIVGVAEIAVTQSAVELHKRRLMKEGLNSGEAEVRAYQFRRERASRVHQKLAEEYGSEHYSVRARKQETAWDLEDVKKLIKLAADPSYRWEKGIHKGTPNWGKIAPEIGVSAKQAREVYSNTSRGIINGTVLGELIQYGNEVGLYIPEPSTNWKDVICAAEMLIASDPQSYVWQSGGNEGKPCWKVIVKKLRSEGIDVPEDIRYISHAYKRAHKNK